MYARNDEIDRDACRCYRRSAAGDDKMAAEIAFVYSCTLLGKRQSTGGIAVGSKHNPDCVTVCAWERRVGKGRYAK